MSERLGIFGGTFNPIHYAHLRLAEEAREACALDRVLFLPAATPPHKALAAHEPDFASRCAMVRLAVADHPAFELSELEGASPGKNYSVETLGRLKGLYPAADLFFIIGMDSFRDLASWHRYRQIFSLANLVVVRRPGVADDLQSLLPVAVQEEFCYDSTAKSLCHVSGKQIIPLAETYLDISSTAIRRLVTANRSIRYLLPPTVAEYIEQHALYRGGERH